MSDVTISKANQLTDTDPQNRSDAVEFVGLRVCVIVIALCNDHISELEFLKPQEATPRLPANDQDVAAECRYPKQYLKANTKHTRTIRTRTTNKKNYRTQHF